MAATGLDRDWLPWVAGKSAVSSGDTLQRRRVTHMIERLVWRVGDLH